MPGFSLLGSKRPLAKESGWIPRVRFLRHCLWFQGSEMLPKRFEVWCGYYCASSRGQQFRNLLLYSLQAIRQRWDWTKRRSHADPSRLIVSPRPLKREQETFRLIASLVEVLHAKIVSVQFVFPPPTEQGQRQRICGLSGRRHVRSYEDQRNTSNLPPCLAGHLPRGGMQCCVCDPMGQYTCQFTFTLKSNQESKANVLVATRRSESSHFVTINHSSVHRKVCVRVLRQLLGHPRNVIGDHRIAQYRGLLLKRGRKLLAYFWFFLLVQVLAPSDLSVSNGVDFFV